MSTLAPSSDTGYMFLEPMSNLVLNGNTKYIVLVPEITPQLKYWANDHMDCACYRYLDTPNRYLVADPFGTVVILLRV